MNDYANSCIDDIGGGNNLIACVISLNAYQVANLKAAIEAAGYPAGMAEHEGIPQNPICAINTGDWLGELYYMLPNVGMKPNTSPQEMAKNALEFTK